MAALKRAGVAFTLDMVGVDTLDGAMQRLVHQLDLGGQVRFLGFKTQRELRPIMQTADLMVLSSLHEAGPLVLLEAAVAGVPTVGTAVGHLVSGHRCAHSRYRRATGPGWQKPSARSWPTTSCACAWPGRRNAVRYARTRR